MHPRLYRAACSALLGLQVGEVIDHYPEIAEDEPYEKYERLRKTKEVYRRVSRLASRELFSTAETWRFSTPWQSTRSSKSLFSTSSSYWVVVNLKILRGVICGAALKWLWTTIVELQIFGYVFALSSLQYFKTNRTQYFWTLIIRQLSVYFYFAINTCIGYWLSPSIHGSDQLNLPVFDAGSSRNPQLCTTFIRF